MKTIDKVVGASKISIDSISAGELLPKNSNDSPDIQTQAALNDFDGERLRGLEQDREMRRDYAGKIFSLVKVWLISVGLILIFSGFGKACNFFTLEPSILTTLVGGTTLGVVGLFATVAKYLFNEKQIK